MLEDLLTWGGGAPGGKIWDDEDATVSYAGGSSSSGLSLKGVPVSARPLVDVGPLVAWRLGLPLESTSCELVGWSRLLGGATFGVLTIRTV